MNPTIADTLTAISALVVWTGAPDRLGAQTQGTNPPSYFSTVAISARVLVQNPNTTRPQNGRLTVTPGPIQQTITSATLVKYLHEDIGTPLNATLVFVQPTNTLMLRDAHRRTYDLQGVLTLSAIGTNDVMWGSHYFFAANSPPRMRNDLQLTTLTYDATAVGGKRRFSMTGLGALSVLDTAPNLHGQYIELRTFKLENASGEGVDASNNPIVLTGTMRVTLPESQSFRP